MSCKICMGYSGASSLCSEHESERIQEERVNRLRAELEKVKAERDAMEKVVVAATILSNRWDGFTPPFPTDAYNLKALNLALQSFAKLGSPSGNEG